MANRLLTAAEEAAELAARLARTEAREGVEGAEDAARAALKATREGDRSVQITTGRIAREVTDAPTNSFGVKAMPDVSAVPAASVTRPRTSAPSKTQTAIPRSNAPDSGLFDTPPTSGGGMAAEMNTDARLHRGAFARTEGRNDFTHRSTTTIDNGAPPPGATPPGGGNTGGLGKSKYEIDVENNIKRRTFLNAINEDLGHVSSGDGLRALDNTGLLGLEKNIRNNGQLDVNAPPVNSLEELIDRLRLDGNPGGQLTGDFNAVDKFFIAADHGAQIRPADFQRFIREPQLKLWAETHLAKSNTNYGTQLLNIADGKGDSTVSQVVKEIGELRKTTEYQAAVPKGGKVLSPQASMIAMQEGKLINDESWNQLARFLGAKKSVPAPATDTTGKVLDGAGGLFKGLITHTVGLPWKAANALDTLSWRYLGSGPMPMLTRNTTSKALTTVASVFGLGVIGAGGLTLYDPEHPTGGGVGRSVANLFDLDTIGKGDGRPKLETRLVDIMQGNTGEANRMLQEYFGINDKGQLVQKNEKGGYEVQKVKTTLPDGRVVEREVNVDPAEARYRIALAIQSAGTFDNPEIKTAVQKWLSLQIKEFKGDATKEADLVASAQEDYTSTKASSMRANPAVLNSMVSKALNLDLSTGKVTDAKIGEALLNNQNAGTIEYYAVRKFYAQQLFGEKSNEEDITKITKALSARGQEKGIQVQQQMIVDQVLGQTPSSQPIDLSTAWDRIANAGIELPDNEATAFTTYFNKNVGPDLILSANEAKTLNTDLTGKIDPGRLTSVMQKLEVPAP